MSTGEGTGSRIAATEMFSSATFLVSALVQASTVAALRKERGRVIYDDAQSKEGRKSGDEVAAAFGDAEDSLSTQYIVLATDSTTAIQQHRRLEFWLVENKISPSVAEYARWARIPVVTEQWVHACRCSSHIRTGISRSSDASLLLNDEALVIYNPFLFAGVSFTTTQLPLQLKANIIAVLQFYGATYHRHLTTATQLVLYSNMPMLCQRPPSKKTPLQQWRAEVLTCRSLSHGNEMIATAAAAVQETPASCMPNHLKASDGIAAGVAPMPVTKLEVAKLNGIPCKTPQWLQQCLSTNSLQPTRSITNFSSENVTTTPTLTSLEPSAALQNKETQKAMDLMVNEVLEVPHPKEEQRRGAVLHEATLMRQRSAGKRPRE